MTRRLILNLDARLENVAPAARAARGACSLVNENEAWLDRIELCVVEAVTNAVEHGPPMSRVELHVELDDAGEVRLEVIDEGGPWHERPPSDQDEWAEGGRGLPILRAAMDSVDRFRIGCRNVVRLRSRFVGLHS